jgi:hypothetical protein
MEYTVERQRELIARAYPGTSWRNRVKNMKPAQVSAIFLRMKQDGRLDELLLNKKRW